MSLAKKLLFIFKNVTLTLGVLEGVALIVVGLNIVILGTSVPMLDALYCVGGLVGGGVMVMGAVLCRYCYLQMDSWFFLRTRWEICRAEFLARIIAAACFLGSAGSFLAGMGGSTLLFLAALIAIVFDRFLVHESRKFIALHHRF